MKAFINSLRGELAELTALASAIDRQSDLPNVVRERAKTLAELVAFIKQQCQRIEEALEQDEVNLEYTACEEALK